MYGVPCCHDRMRFVGIFDFWRDRTHVHYFAITHTHTRAHTSTGPLIVGQWWWIMLSARRVSVARASHNGGVKLRDKSAGGNLLQGVGGGFIFSRERGKVNGFVNEIERSTGYDGRTLFLRRVSCSAVHSLSMSSLRLRVFLPHTHAHTNSFHLSHSFNLFCWTGFAIYTHRRLIMCVCVCVCVFFFIEIEIVTGRYDTYSPLRFSAMTTTTIIRTPNVDIYGDVYANERVYVPLYVCTNLSAGSWPLPDTKMDIVGKQKRFFYYYYFVFQ